MNLTAIIRNLCQRATSAEHGVVRMPSPGGVATVAFAMLQLLASSIFPSVAEGQPYIAEFNLEIDYMVGTDHSHAPDSSVVSALVEMFACEDILLRIEVSDSIHEPENQASYWNGDDSTAHSGMYYRSRYFNHINDEGWWYCVIVHDMVDEAGGGRAELTYYWIWVEGRVHWSSLWYQAHMIAHEFGHLLGLDHHGGPNYPSVMNYSYQSGAWWGINSGFVCQGYAAQSCPNLKRLNYSHGTLPDLNDNALNEVAGMGFGPIDWNCNGVIDEQPVAACIRSNSRCGFGCGLEGPSTDLDDWTYIKNRWGNEAARSGRGFTPAQSAALEGGGICEVPEYVEVSGLPFNPISECWSNYAIRSASMVAEACATPFEADSDEDGRDDYCDPCPHQAENTCCCVGPGDANDSGGRANSADRDFLVVYVFQSGPAPECVDEGDANGNNVITMADIIYLNNFLFYEGSFPICGLTGN